MNSSERAETRLAAFRASLRLQSARRAFDVVLENASGLPGYHFGPPENEALNEVHYVDEVSGERPFTLGSADGELMFDVHEAGFGQVPGGLPALEVGLGPVSELETGAWRLRISRPAQAEALIHLLFNREPTASLKLRHWWLTLGDGEPSEI